MGRGHRPSEVRAAVRRSSEGAPALAQIRSIGGAGLHVEGGTSLGLDGHTGVTIGSRVDLLLRSLGRLIEQHDLAPRLVANAAGLGFFGAEPIGKPTVAGSRSNGAALADLLSKLAALGLITDATTP